MNKVYRYLFLILFFSKNLIAQQVSLLPATQFVEKVKSDRIKAEQIARELGIELRSINQLGQILEFSHFDSKGKMQFFITDNVGAGRTTSTNKVWPGGTVGTSLTGLNMPGRLGEWDGGAVLTTHQEYAGRVTQADGATNVIDHATHVAGTMIATGISANAKGMAYQTTLKAYDWNNNVSEMQAATGMLVSNHSYGTISGWYYNGSKYVWWGDTTISKKEDYKFGYYDYTSQAWDDLVAQNPYHLIIKSAGNDRGDGSGMSGTSYTYFNGSSEVVVQGTPPPADGPYDCISTYSGAKNVLTVGAVSKIGGNTGNGWTKTSDVVMSSFSGWGPMDDGRLKPDVVGCGVNLYSATSDSNKAYTTMSGTSMASPNVSGSLLLVQQHYNNLKNKFMLAATLKAVAIHTADEAGNSGPDFQFGYGLINTATAVNLITDSVTNQISERTLQTGKTFTQGISSAGVTPLKITIVWTDPAGTPINPPVLDGATKMLVNDLDIRLTRLSDNTVFFPYILSKDTPSAVARTGDNTVDNVEQIYLATPNAGNYTLTVSHKGTLRGSLQNYSLVISGLMGLPSAIFSSSTKSACTGTSVSYTDNSSGTPTSRKWYFFGGSPSTSTAASTNVTYSTAGKYAVALVVSNGLGTDSVYIPNYITAGGLNLPFTETFEPNSSTLSSWTINNPNADTTWRLASVGGSTPGNTAYCMPFFNYNLIGRRDGLITPALSFKGYSSVNLNFQHAYAIDSTNSTRDSFTVWVSTNCGSTWTEITSRAENANGTSGLKTSQATLNEFVPKTTNDWCMGSSNNCITLPLNSYVGLNNIKIKFEGYNNYNNNFYIDNVSITGTPLAPKANFYASKKITCVGETVNFFDSTINNATAWEWTFNGASISTSTLQNPSGLKFNTPGVYDVKLKVSNATGSDSVTKIGYITVVANPNKPHITASSKTTLCTGDSVILVCDSPATTYQWRVAGNKIGGATNVTYVVKDAGVYKVDAINANGCATSSDSINVLYNSYPAKPTITSSLSGTFMCTGGTATMTSSSTTGNQWYRNNIALTGATNVSYNSADSGDFTVRVTLFSCESPSSDIKRIDLMPSPTTSAITGSDTGMRYRNKAYSVTSTPGSSYNWTITGGTKVSGGTTASIQVQWTSAGAGSVKVQETATNGCKGNTQTLNVNITDNVGLNKLNESIFNVYPNPGDKEITIQLINNVIVAHYRLLDISGRVIASGDALGSRFILNTASLEQGIYLLEIQTGDYSEMKKIQIKH